MRTLVGCLLVLAVFVLPGHASAVTRDIQGGGPVTATDAWPWMVGIVATDASGNFVTGCTGELIGPTTVLTAAHCLVPLPADDPPANYIVTPARDNAWMDGPGPLQPLTPYETVSAASVIPDPAFPTNGNFPAVDDVGIIPLAAPFAGTTWLPLVQPSQLGPFAGSFFSNIFPGLTAGYGLSTPNGTDFGTLRETLIQHVTSDVGFGDPTDNSGALWEWQNGTQSGTCEGDSGGALIVPIGGGPLPVTTDPTTANGHWAVLGITHSGPNWACNFGSFENVASSVPWANVAGWLAPYETPVNFVPPAVTGAAVTGHPVTCDPGTWAEPSATFTYTWATVGGGTIAGANAQTYRPLLTDAGAQVECTATATVPGFGSTDAVTSAPVSVALGCVVPDVIRKTLTDAKHAIHQAYCTVGRITMKTSKTILWGRVISQSHPPDTELPVQSRVALIVSAGSRT